jgi:hypothetical protein
MDSENAIQAVHYLPIFSTLLATIFSAILLARYAQRRTGPHLLWWGLGIAVYGLGTALEASITLFGNTIALTKAWYIAGALLGGYPLAQGSVYLLLQRRTAHLLSAITVPIILAVSFLVIVSPVIEGALEAHRPSGAILGWTWVRALTPLINGYAVVFLIGGAIYSASKFWRRLEPGAGHRAVGNAVIAFGALLPGIGGTMAKAGMVEALYVGEFVGLLFIWAGFEINVRALRGRVAGAHAAA